MIMGAKLLIFSGFVVLVSFYQAEVAAFDTALRQKRATCDKQFNTPQGTIESPNYPSFYPSYASCTWTITVPGNSRITLTFTSFQLESSSSCAYDYLEIRDGRYSNSDLLTKLCGNSIPERIESTGNAMILRFRTDGSSQFQGFRVEFRSVPLCGGELMSDQGDITSPHYPQDYVSDENCMWTITLPVGYQVMLRFRSFQLEASYHCEADFLAVYDGPGIQSPSMGTFCGSSTIQDILSTSNTMTVVFKSDGASNFRGFSAQYRKVENTELAVATGNTPAVSLVGTTLCLVFLGLI